MTPEMLAEIAAEANLAPSVHNTQPVKWALDGTDALILSLDPGRRLAVGDPGGQDAKLSGGAALLGTKFALMRRGFGPHSVEIDGSHVRIAFGADPSETPPSPDVLARRTSYRAGFAPADPMLKSAFSDALRDREDVALATDPADIARLSELNDHASLGVMRGHAFRAELLSWMRLSKSHEDWARDGLSAEALAMGGGEAWGAGLVLRRPIFEALAGLGLPRHIVAEDARTRSATALVAYHRDASEDRWTSGSAFYALWLALTEAGFAAWPMAVLADDKDANAEVCAMHGIPDSRALITVLRVGPHPGVKQPNKARLPGKELIKAV